jgi:nucleotidyltransferase/DNA polymerase involved in DNA repair
MIAHLDSDCFYVSAERVRHEYLKGIPVGVLSNQGACVIAKSYELKSFGIKTGHPIWEAQPLCPHAVYIKRDFRWYESISRRMHEIIKQVSQKVEYYSIDEFFFDAGYLAQYYRSSLDDSVHQLQKQILHSVGVPVSIGVAKTKTLAKLGSDSAKPFGYRVLFDEKEITELLKSQDVGEITGIGSRSRKKLNEISIHNCEQFRQADPKMINRLLTKKGEMLYWELHGEPIQKIVTNRPMHKHVARGGSIGRASNDPKKVNGWLVRNVERLTEALNSYGYVCSKVGLSLLFKNSMHWGDSVSLPEATSDSDLILPAVQSVLNQCWPDDWLVVQMHLVADNLELRGRHQLSLFVERNKKNDCIKESVNQKIGRFSLRSGTTLQINDVYADSTNDYDICDITGKSCF